MASILVDLKQNGDYVRLVESYRDVDGKSKIRSLAQQTECEKNCFAQKIAEKLDRLVGVDIDRLPHTGIKELARYNFGFYQVVNHGFKVCRRVGGITVALP